MKSDFACTLKLRIFRADFRPEWKRIYNFFRESEKTRRNFCGIAMPFSAAYPLAEYYLQRESTPLQVIAFWRPAKLTLLGLAWHKATKTESENANNRPTKNQEKNKFNNQQDTNTKATMDQPKSTTDQRKQQTSSKQQLSTQTSTRIQQTPNSKSTKSQQTWQTPKNKQTNKTTNQTATNNQQSNQ